MHSPGGPDNPCSSEKPGKAGLDQVTRGFRTCAQVGYYVLGGPGQVPCVRKVCSSIHMKKRRALPQPEFGDMPQEISRHAPISFCSLVFTKGTPGVQTQKRVLAKPSKPLIRTAGPPRLWMPPARPWMPTGHGTLGHRSKCKDRWSL